MSKVAMLHEKDPRENLIAAAGDLSNFELLNNELLVAIYLRPEKTSGGIILTAKNLEEDLYQSKAHLVLKIGPTADFPTIQIAVHDWILLRPSDAYSLDVNGVSCRLVQDKYVRAKISKPDIVW